MGFVGDDDDVVAARTGAGSARPLRGQNFWMVVKTTPPDATCKQLVADRRGPSAWTGCLAQQFVAAREGAEQLLVEVVAVGEHDEGRVAHGRVRG